jgi:hypothetical protein
MKTQKVLAVIVVLQGLILIGQWTGGSSGVLPTAHAQIPDPANRQMQMIDELKNINGKMDQVISILRDGELQVKVAKSEENKGTTSKAK